MKKEEFDIEKFKEAEGLNNKREKYDYQKYLAINPKLTKKMYDFLYHNGSLWKVRCGKKVVIKWDTEVLEPVWWLDTPENYAKRYTYED